MTLLFEHDLTTLPIADSSGDRFPVRRIYCVGRNYVDHIREMREGDERDDPFFFQKPTDSIVAVNSGPTNTRLAVPYPPQTNDLQYEGELVVAIGSPARGVAPSQAVEHIFGYAAGIDLTRRDRQRDARERQVSWEAGKSFDHSAPCGAITPRERAGDINTAQLSLSVNDAVRQSTSISLMIWNVPEIISHLSHDYLLQPGDLVYTGTPAGVGAVQPGDRLDLTVGNLSPLSIVINEPGGTR